MHHHHATVSYSGACVSVAIRVKKTAFLLFVIVVHLRSGLFLTSAML